MPLWYKVYHILIHTHLYYVSSFLKFLKFFLNKMIIINCLVKHSQVFFVDIDIFIVFKEFYKLKIIKDHMHII